MVDLIVNIYILCIENSVARTLVNVEGFIKLSPF